MVWMRNSAFPTFKKLYGRILLEQNAKLAHRIPVARNETGFHSFLKIRSKFGEYFKGLRRDGNETELYFGLNNTTMTPLAMKSEETVWYNTYYRLPKGEYYIDIDYSKLGAILFLFVTFARFYFCFKDIWLSKWEVESFLY